MTDTVMTALITGGLAVISNLLISWQSGSKTLYRIDQLEKKVEESNKVKERVVKLEQNDKAQWKYIDELKEHFKQ